MSNQNSNIFDDLKENESVNFSDGGFNDGQLSVGSKKSANQKQKFSYPNPILETSREYKSIDGSSHNHSSLVESSSSDYSFHSGSEAGLEEVSRSVKSKEIIPAFKSQENLSEFDDEEVKSDTSIVDRLKESSPDVAIENEDSYLLPYPNDSLSPKFITNENPKANRRKIFPAKKDKIEISSNIDVKRRKIFSAREILLEERILPAAEDEEVKLNNDYMARIERIRDVLRKSEPKEIEPKIEKKQKIKLTLTQKENKSNKKINSGGIRMTLVEDEKARKIRSGIKMTLLRKEIEPKIENKQRIEVTYGPEKIPGGTHYIKKQNQTSIEQPKEASQAKRKRLPIFSKDPKNNISNVSESNKVDNGCCWPF